METKLKKGLFCVRPKYERTSKLPPCQVIDALQEHIIPGCGVVGETLGNYATLKISENERSFWSPEFSIHAVKRGNGSVIKGIMGPGSKIWSVSMLLNILAIMLFFLGVFMIINQWIFDIDSRLIWSLPAGLCVALFVVILAKTGQYKGKQQMAVLWRFVEESVDEKEIKQEED